MTPEWQAHIGQTIAEAETDFEAKHLITQNIANKHMKIIDPNPLVSIFNFHYAKPPDMVTDHYGLNKVIGNDETGFAGSEPKPYGLEGWDFVIAGGIRILQSPAYKDDIALRILRLDSTYL